jgi:signal transduction histidine kinase
VAAIALMSDALTPQMIAVEVLYVGVVLTGFWFPKPATALTLALLASVLIIIGYWLAIPDNAPPWAAWTNRVLAIFSVWMTAFFVWYIRNLQDALQTQIGVGKIAEHALQSKGHDLEDLVAARTRELKDEMHRREEMQAALLHSQKLDALGQLTGGIAHDFNNLLNIIIGNLELLDMRIEEPPHQDLIRRASHAALMGEGLTRRLLSIARRQPLDPQVMDLNELISNTTELMRRSLGETVELTTDLAADLWPTRLDQSQIEAAILNLSVNARDAMPKGGKLLIKTGNAVIEHSQPVGELAPGDYVSMVVADTGVGMGPEVLGRIFEPFFTTKPHGSGTGLGLPTIYGFVKQSGGHFTVQSAPARGTIMTLYFPRARDEEMISPRPADLPSREAAGETILIVEDNADVRDVTMRRLASLGYRVIDAPDGPGAVTVLQENASIDLVFSDIVMPGGMMGYELANWIKDNRCGTKVLLTSGYDAEITRQQASPSNMKILRKPYQVEQLARAIRSAMTT